MVCRTAVSGTTARRIEAPAAEAPRRHPAQGSKDMLTLYHNDMSVCAAKVRLVLAEKGLNATLKHMDLRKGDQFAPDYLKLNPNGVVPTLVHNGAAVIESTHICEYLDEAFPQNPLRPADLAARAEMRAWAAIPDTGLHPACGTISNAAAFRHQYLALSKEALERNLAETPDPARRERKRLGIELGMDAPGVKDAVKLHDRLLARMEKRLADGRPYLMGEQYTLADAALTPYVTRLAHLHWDGLWAERPRVGDWFARIKARPNYRGIADWVNPKYIALFDAHWRETWPRAQELAKA
jgi:glutathione S-transferase